MNYAPFKPPFVYDEKFNSICDATGCVFEMSVIPVLDDEEQRKAANAIGHRVAELMTRDAAMQDEERSLREKRKEKSGLESDIYRGGHGKDEIL